MWRIWLMFDPRQGLVAVLAVAVIMVMTNHLCNSSPRCRSWLYGEEAYRPPRLSTCGRIRIARAREWVIARLGKKGRVVSVRFCSIRGPAPLAR